MRSYSALRALCDAHGLAFFAFSEIGSTNSFAREYAEEHEGSAVFVAERQSQGRGTHGRSFQSERGGLYMTLLLRPRAEIADVTYYTAYTGVALAETIERLYGAKVGIKWVNDCFIEGKKVAGILTEAALVPGTSLCSYVAVGIGVNVGAQHFEGELRHTAGSLAQLCPRTPDAEQLAAAVCEAILALDRVPRTEVMRRYRERSVVIGKEVVLVREGRAEVALATDILDTGELVVLHDGRGVEYISSGDVRLRITGDDNEGLQNGT